MRILSNILKHRNIVNLHNYFIENVNKTNTGTRFKDFMST